MHLIWTCEHCGREVPLRYAGDLARCSCAKGAIPRPPRCINRGDLAGVASCGCGQVYKCKLLPGVLCGSREPIDDLVDCNGTLLTRETYRCLPTCPDRPPTT